MNTHKGKIGRLPTAVREQLNQRLLDGETGAMVLPWLNSLPAVKTLLANRFNGEPVNDQNLTNWRAGGYVQWQKQQERRAIVQELAEEGRELETGSPVQETVLNQCLSRVLTADFAMAARELLANLTDPAERCQRLQEFLHTLKFQRREDYLTERLKIDLERRARERRAEQEQDEEFRENDIWGRQVQQGDLEKLFAVFNFVSQLEGVHESESLLRSMKSATRSAGSSPPG